MLSEGPYTVKTENYEFLLKVTIIDNTVFELQYGDPSTPQGPCMELSYDLRKPKRINLESLVYDARCSTDGKLQKGGGTLEMVNSIFAICKREMPEAERIFFKDVSDFDCQGERIILANYSLLIHGYTWYERHFGAVMRDRMGRKRLDLFRERILFEKPKAGVFKGLDASLIKSCETWHSLFNDLYQSHGCSAFVNLLDQVPKIAQVRLYYSEWTIKMCHVLPPATLTYSQSKSKVKKNNRLTSHFGGGHLTLEDAML